MCLYCIVLPLGLAVYLQVESCGKFSLDAKKIA